MVRALCFALGLLAAGCGNGAEVAADGGDVARTDARDASDVVVPRDVLGDTGGDVVGDVGSDAGCVPALRADGCPEYVPTGFLPAACDFGCNASTLGTTCGYATQRCRCGTGAGYYWRCDPLECPEAGAVAGDPCTNTSVRCGAGFEDPGLTCIPGDMVWVACQYVRSSTAGNGLHCPPVAPSEGTRCCLVDVGGGVPRQCRYTDGDGGQSSFDCVNYHWTRLAP